MKTEMALLLQTEGRPVMSLGELAALLNISERTAENQIYKHKLPVPSFKMGSEWMVHVSDVARYIDEQRAKALAEFEKRAA